MDLKDQLKQIADKINKFKDLTNTEEATKNAFVLPFIGALGYDVFNPQEVMPEFTADIGIKVGEKVDYAILKDNLPIILIECKHWKDALNIHDTQLLRYFNVTKAKFAILTNGIIYRFYTESEPNIMDVKPFLDINIVEIKDNQIEELKKFHKSYFDTANILATANTLKYSNEIKMLLNNEFKQPSEEFIKYFVFQVYSGRATEKVMKQFSEIVKISIQQFLSDLITERLKTALNKEKESEPKPIEPESKKVTVDTTDEEIEGYYIVKSIVRSVIASDRIFYRDFQSFFSVLIDDSIRNTLCRLYLTETDKQIAFLDESKNEIKYQVTTIDDIFKYSEKLKDIAKRFI
ncbi:MAG: type I restriction enzyme HsdR N-terminal domain-containing protein [Bacteroidales bacterium]|nr:type I restriction enzyme HsdR N-terminal domain-containing protein [Bacteroidales bacterium]